MGSQVRLLQQLYDSADDIYGLPCNSSYAGKLGFGRVNAFNAVNINCEDIDGDGYSTCNGDCDDTDFNVNPGVTEVCDSKDNNCDGQIDEGMTITFYSDNDGDSYGDPTSSIESCSAPSGYVDDNTDCNDNNFNVNPGATEVCNGVDDDCNGNIDEGLPDYTFYYDSDSDGYGDPNNSIEACSAPMGYTTNNSDCDDNNGGVNPGATEVCDDSIDNDCDSLTDCADNSDCNGDPNCTSECIANKRWCDCDGQCGKWESNETCPWDCPESGCTSDSECDDGDDCTTDVCQTETGECSYTWAACGLADGCCGPACTSETDPDCDSCIPSSNCNCNGKCGKKETQETCPWDCT